MPRTTDELLKDAEEIRKRTVHARDHREVERLLHDAGELIAELSAKLREREWQPIETAPKDGTKIIGTADFIDSYCVAHEIVNSINIPRWFQYGYWGEGKWKLILNDEYYPEYHLPTHWKPLPTPPKKETSDEEALRQLGWTPKKED